MLTEVILGSETGDKALAVALDYVAAIKKTPIVVNDTRGFFVNRCVFRYINEAYDMLIEGVPPTMIENAAKMAGMPVGPLSLNDEVAIDLSLKILKATVADLGEKAVDPKHMELVSRMVEKEGRLGRKNAKGFYDYPPKPAKKSLWPDLKTFYPQKQADEVDVNVLKQRFLVTIALEAARTMEEGIVTDPREADVGSILGFGFAPYTGGALSYIDGMGAKALRGIVRNVGCVLRIALQADGAAEGDGCERRDVLWTVRSLWCEGGGVSRLCIAPRYAGKEIAPLFLAAALPWTQFPIRCSPIDLAR